MKQILLVAGIATCLVYTSCTNNQHNKDLAAPAEAPATTAAGAELNEPSPDFSPAPQPDSGATPNQQHASVQQQVNIDWDKKIIKTATLKMEVADFKKYSGNVYNMVKAAGGYIAKEDLHNTTVRNESEICIKVPVMQFESLMNALSMDDAKLIERTIASDDVTGRIVDAKSRLEAKKEMRLKYLEFLRESKNMKDVLQVQQEINNIQEGIEAATGQVNYLSHEAAMSTINLTYFQDIAGVQPEKEEKPSFFTRVTTAFRSGANWIADLFVAILSIWPLIFLLSAFIFIIRRVTSTKVKVEPKQ